MSNTHIIPTVYDLMDLDERYGKWSENGNIELYRPGFNTQLDKIRFRSFAANIRSELQNMTAPEFVCDICAGLYYIGNDDDETTETDFTHFTESPKIHITNKTGKHTFTTSNEYKNGNLCFSLESFRVPLISSFSYSVAKLYEYANTRIKTILGINGDTVTNFATGDNIAREHIEITSENNFLTPCAFRRFYIQGSTYSSYFFTGSPGEWKKVQYSGIIENNKPQNFGTVTTYNATPLYLDRPMYIDGQRYRGLCFNSVDSFGSSYLWDLSQSFQLWNPSTTPYDVFAPVLTVTGIIPLTFDAKINPFNENKFILSFIQYNNELPDEITPANYKNGYLIQSERRYTLRYSMNWEESAILLNLTSSSYSFAGWYIVAHSLAYFAYGLGSNSCFLLAIVFIDETGKKLRLYAEEFSSLPLVVSPSSDTVEEYSSTYYACPLFVDDWTDSNICEKFNILHNIAPLNEIYFTLPADSSGRNILINYTRKPALAGAFIDLSSDGSISSIFPFGSYLICSRIKNGKEYIKAGSCSQFLNALDENRTPWNYCDKYCTRFDPIMTFLHLYEFYEVTEINRATGCNLPYLAPIFELNEITETYNGFTLNIPEDTAELLWASSSVNYSGTLTRWWSVDNTHLNTCNFNFCNCYICAEINGETVSPYVPEINEPPAEEEEISDDKYYFKQSPHITKYTGTPYAYAFESSNWRELFKLYEDGERFHVVEIPLYSETNKNRYLLAFYVDFYTSPTVMRFDYSMQYFPRFWVESSGSISEDIDTKTQIAEHFPSVFPVVKNLSEYTTINDAELFDRINVYLALQNTDLTLKLISPIAHTQNNIVFYLNESSAIEFKEYETGPNDMKVDALIIDAAGEILTPSDAGKIYSNITISLDWQFY